MPLSRKPKAQPNDQPIKGIVLKRISQLQEEDKLRKFKEAKRKDNRAGPKRYKDNRAGPKKQVERK